MNSLIICIGAPASGKSTWATKFCAENEYVYLNADSFRGILGKDDSDQSVNKEVFEHLEIFVEYLIKTRQNCCIDNMNTTRLNRCLWLESAKEGGFDAKAVVFQTPQEVCVARNGARARKVPDFVIDRFFKRFEQPTREEGFDSIEIVEYKEEC